MNSGDILFIYNLYIIYLLFKNTLGTHNNTFLAYEQLTVVIYSSEFI